jgi:hypothetical protein
LGCCKFWGIISFAFGGHHAFLLCAIDNFQFWVVVGCSIWQVEAWISSFFVQNNHDP